MPKIIVAAFAAILIFTSCSKNDTITPPTPVANLVFKFQFDSTQARLNNIGLAAAMPAGHAGQNPKMNTMSAHYIELAPSAFTQIGNGAIIYKAAETTTGGSNAINFSQALFAGNGETFFTMPLKNIIPGEYQYLRVSLAYQNFDVTWHLDTTITGLPGGPVPVSQDFAGTVASFVGYNSYLNAYKIKNQTITVNGNRAQGYWGFETGGTILGFPFNQTATGQAPANATTVVNPIAATSPIPAGSCLVTGAFSGGNKLTITGKETKDIVVTVSLSTNKSFEWIDTNGNGKWDATKGEQIVDMGLRGLVPAFQ
ncbi:MAG: hypothetical protein WKF88_07445 [Ferruginibacter sp.]